jgi:hypothetical protein
MPTRPRTRAKPTDDPRVGRRSRRQPAAPTTGTTSRGTTHAAAVVLGALGGQARAKTLSAKRLTQIGRQGAAARWVKKRGSR